ncbi:MAG: hypothetical protein ABII22_01830 [Candidatus Micrarchaeota archaeon]
MKKQNRNKEIIIKYKDFRCQNMKEFTFSYPTIKGWGEAKVEQNVPNLCTISYENSDEYFPKIIVEKSSIGINDASWRYFRPLIPLRGLPPQKNPKGVKFGYFETPFRGNWCQFFGKKFSVKVKIQEMEDDPEFEMVFFRKVMETFKFI